MFGNFSRLRKFVLALATEGSHNGIAAVLKTAGRDPVGVRVPRPPLRPEDSPHSFIHEGTDFLFVQERPT